MSDEDKIFVDFLESSSDRVKEIDKNIKQNTKEYKEKMKEILSTL